MGFNVGNFVKGFVKAITNPETLVMAAVTVGLAFATGGLSVALTASTFLTYTAIVASVMSATQALAPIPKMPNFTDFVGELQNRTQMTKHVRSFKHFENQLFQTFILLYV